MREFEKLFSVIKASAVHKYTKIHGHEMAVMHSIALEQMKPIFKAVYDQGAKDSKQQVKALKESSEVNDECI